jgi:hypothetical protein
MAAGPPASGAVPVVITSLRSRPRLGREHIVPRGGRGCPGDLLDLAAGLRGLLGRESLPGRVCKATAIAYLWHLGNRVAS